MNERKGRIFLKLEWMGEYREMIEKLIKYCNVYALVYNKEMEIGIEAKISLSQIQVVEYLLENEDLHQNMSEIACRLGISPSAFSKLINRLSQKGFLNKYHTSENRKDIIIRVTDYGREIYRQYADYIIGTHFSKMFQVANEIPKEYIPKIAKMLDVGICMYQPAAKEADLPVVLIQIEDKP